MELQSGNYLLSFRDGGVEVLRGGKLLYFNRRPMYALVKTVLSITEFYDAPYEKTEQDGSRVIAEGVLKTPTGEELGMKDVYETADIGFKDHHGPEEYRRLRIRLQDFLRAGRLRQRAGLRLFFPGQLVPAERVFEALQHGL